MCTYTVYAEIKLQIGISRVIDQGCVGLTTNTELQDAR